MEFEVPRHFLLPGDIAFAREKSHLSTLLGSCVAVCLYDARLKVGGMNHFMLPSRAEGRAMLAEGKYGDYAIPRLLAMAREAGCAPQSLVASVFGGGNVAGHLGSLTETGMFNIGARNVEFALANLRELGIRVVRHDTGEKTARKIRMDTETDEISVSYVSQSEENVLREKKLEQFRRRKIKVLVVDDSRLVRKILKTAINAADDMEVYAEAADPYEARERILADDPDVICLDLIMPRMDGVTFLKKLMNYKYIPTVVVSTMAKEGSDMRQRALDAGAFAAVDKDNLCIYKGMDLLNQNLLPQLRMAAATVKQS